MKKLISLILIISLLTTPLYAGTKNAITGLVCIFTSIYLLHQDEKFDDKIDNYRNLEEQHWKLSKKYTYQAGHYSNSNWYTRLDYLALAEEERAKAISYQNKVEDVAVKRGICKGSAYGLMAAGFLFWILPTQDKVEVDIGANEYKVSYNIKW